LAFFLLPDKTQRSYARALDVLLAKIDTLQPGRRPTHFLIDFEKAEENAIREKMQEVDIHGCFFHYCQAVWRKVQAIGMEAKYIQDKVFRNSIKFRGVDLIEEDDDEEEEQIERNDDEEEEQSGEEESDEN
jgi:hypothetical protein